jgi:hypothetical protein
MPLGNFDSDEPTYGVVGDPAYQRQLLAATVSSQPNPAAVLRDDGLVSNGCQRAREQAVPAINSHSTWMPESSRSTPLSTLRSRSTSSVEHQQVHRLLSATVAVSTYGHWHIAVIQTPMDC